MLAREIREIHNRSLRKTGLAGIGWEKSAFIPSEISSNPCQSCFPHAPAEYSAGNRTHHHLSGVRRPTKHLPSHRHYCTIPDAAAGGALGSKGSCDLQRSLAQCRRMRSTMRMRPPQLQSRGSASKIFFINRAHVLRPSLELSELSRSESIAAGEPALSPSAGVAEIRARLE